MNVQQERRPQIQEHLSMQIGAPINRALIATAFRTLRMISKSRGVRLTEGRRTRQDDGSIIVDFVIVKRRG